MDHRMFGKELTNLNPLEPRNRKSYSHIHSGNLKDLSFNHPQRPSFQHGHNKSLIVKDVVEAPPRLENKDPQLVPEYFSDNLEFLRKEEKETYKLSNYLSSHKTISEQERGKLIDWLCKLHLKFKMFPETIFTIVSFIDQYLSKKEVLLS